ncbi:NAA50, partial [Symbiodinium microadriaticum]
MPVIPPLDIELGNVTEHNLQQLKTLNMVALPVRYSEKFYRDLLANSPPEYLKFVFWNGFAIASVCSRLENHPEHPDFKKIYIMTIGVIPAYRRRGV